MGEIAVSVCARCKAGYAVIDFKKARGVRNVCFYKPICNKVCTGTVNSKVYDKESHSFEP